jgi:hypothetical protein
MQTVVWEYLPAYWSPREAWVFSKGQWKERNSSDVGHAGRVVSEAVFAHMFPNLPPLPDEAFRSERAAAKAT